MDYIEYKVRSFPDRIEWLDEQDLLHRTDGPAREWKDGSKEWWINGQLHREDGPAIEWNDGYKVWYINGEPLTEEEFKRQTEPKSSCDGKTIEIDGQKYKLIKA